MKAYSIFCVGAGGCQVVFQAIDGAEKTTTEAEDLTPEEFEAFTRLASMIQDRVIARLEALLGQTHAGIQPLSPKPDGKLN